MTAALDALALSDRAEGAVHFIESAETTTRLGFAELRAKALALLSVLRDRGVESGQFLVMASADNRRFLEAFWACQYGGIVVAPISIGATDEHRAKVGRIFEKLDQPWLLVDAVGSERLEKFAGKASLPEWGAMRERMLPLEELGDLAAAAAPAEPASVEPDDLAFLQFSSGSTREPKGIQLSHRNVVVNSIDIGARGGYGEGDVALNWMPLTHDMGLIGFHCCPVVYGMDHYVMPTDLFTRRPRLWLEKAAEVGANVLGSPNFGYRHYLRALRSRGASEDLDLAHVKLMLDGAEPVSIPLCQEFNEALAPFGLRPTAVCPAYGLAEASVGVGYKAPDEPLRWVSLRRDRLSLGDHVVEVGDDDPDGVILAMCGEPFDQIQLRAVDARDKPVGEGVVGRLQIRGENVTRGYLEDPEANREALVGDGWVDTGDLGLLLDGQMIVTGRAKDVVFVHGQNYYPEDLEAAAIDGGRLQLGKVVAAGVRRPGAERDDVTVFVQYRGSIEGFEESDRAVRRRINRGIGIEVHQVVPVRRIPRTTSGKIQRHRLVADLLAGELETPETSAESSEAPALVAAAETGSAAGPPASGSPDAAALLAELKTICAEVLEDRELGVDQSFFEIGISSLDLVQIVASIDERYPDVLDITDLLEHSTLRAVAELLATRLA